MSAGWALYGLWVVFLVIAGRAKVTTRNFLASLAGLAANVVLLVVLVPSLGIAGAGIALCGAYVAMLAVMYWLTRGPFQVPFEWRRLLQLFGVFGASSALGDFCCRPTGRSGSSRARRVFLAIPVVLYLAGFAHAEELARARSLVGRLRAAAARPAREES